MVSARARGASRLLVAVLGAVAAIAFVRAAYVHEHTWEWRLAPTAFSPKVEFGGRNYHRGAETFAPDPAMLRVGRSRGGAVLYTVSNGRDAPTVLEARLGTRRVVYALSGGP